MTPENFCYWLQGILEIQMAGLDKNEKRIPKLSEAQIEMIAEHLSYVFKAKVELKPFDSLLDPSGITSKIC